MQQSHLQPDWGHAAEAGKYHEQQLGGHYGNESPDRNGEEVAGDGRAQRCECGDKQDLYGEAHVTVCPVMPSALREPIRNEYRNCSHTRRKPVLRLAAAFPPVHADDGRDDRRRNQQIDYAARLAADVPDDHGEEPHEHEGHDDEEEDGRDEQRLVHLGLLEEAAVYELSALLELPVDQAAEDKDADVEVVPLEEGQSERAGYLEAANEHASLGAEHVGHDEYSEAEQADAE